MACIGVVWSLRRFVILVVMLPYSQDAEEARVLETTLYRYIVNLQSCFQSPGHHLVSLQLVTSLPDVLDILLLRRLEHTSHKFQLLERWPLSVHKETLEVFHNVINDNELCFGIRQAVSEFPPDERHSLTLPERRSLRLGLNQTSWVLAESGTGFCMHHILAERSAITLAFLAKLVERAEWHTYLEERLWLVRRRVQTHPCVDVYLALSEDEPFSAFDVWLAFVRFVKQVPSTADGYLIRKMMDFIRVKRPRLSPHKEYDSEQPDLKTSCRALHNTMQRLSAFNVLASVVHFLSADTKGPALLDHLRAVMDYNGLQEPGSIAKAHMESNGSSFVCASSFDALFVRLELEADIIIEKMWKHAESDSVLPWHTNKYFPSYWIDEDLTRWALLLWSPTATLPLPPGLALRQDVLSIWTPISGDTGKIWETFFYEMISFVEALSKDLLFDWWPSSGNLLGLLRYGHAFGQIYPGLEDVVDDDIDVDIKASNVSHIFEIALAVSNHLIKYKNWACCWFTGRSSGTDRRLWVGDSPFNRGALTLTCYKIVYAQRWSKFELDIHFYLLRAESDILQDNPTGPSWGPVVIPIQVEAVKPNTTWLLVENEVYFEGRIYTMNKRRPFSADLVFPLGQCLLVSRFLSDRFATPVPCPGQPSRFLKWHYSESGMVAECLALPRVMKKRNLEDARNRKLALGITYQDIQTLRSIGNGLVESGFKGFTEQDFDECNVSHNPHARYDTLDCTFPVSYESPLCEELRQQAISLTDGRKSQVVIT